MAHAVLNGHINWNPQSSSGTKQNKFHTKGNDSIGPRTMAWKKSSSPSTHRWKRPRNHLHGICRALTLPLQQDNPKLLQSLDQHYCNNTTLNKLLQSHPSVRRRWLKQVKASRAACLNDGQNQQTISKYMTPIPQIRGSHNKQETRLMQPTHRECCKDTNTTQQRMAAYFPGRPPDILPELTHNPLPSQV